MSASSLTCSEPVELHSVVQALRYPPSAPKVLPMLKRELMNSNASLDQIAELVRLDPGILARVLQAANTVLCSRGTRCLAVQEAVSRIGFESIFTLVANAVAEQVLVRPLVSYGLDADEFWRRSVACGLAAERLADLFGEDKQVAYTLGLMHGVGMVAIDHWVERHEPSLGFFDRGFPREHADAERSLLGFTHAEVGVAVLRVWQFPPEMAEPVRWQYSPMEGSPYRRLSCLLYAARWVRSRVCAAENEKVPAPEARFLAPLGLGVSRLESLVWNVEKDLADVQRQLEVELPGEAA